MELQYERRFSPHWNAPGCRRYQAYKTFGTFCSRECWEVYPDPIVISVYANSHRRNVNSNSQYGPVGTSTPGLVVPKSWMAINFIICKTHVPWLDRVKIDSVMTKHQQRIFLVLSKFDDVSSGKLVKCEVIPKTFSRPVYRHPILLAWTLMTSTRWYVNNL